LFREKFSQLDPAGASAYAANERNFSARLAAAERSWTDEIARIRGKPVVAWHTSWRYLADLTKMNIVGFIEPKPGVPPSPAHLAGLINTMRRTGAKVIIMEPFYSRKTADFVAARTGAKVLILPPSVGAIRGVGDYISVLDYDIKQLAAAVQ
jgi:ABC-type Zn uptake system ZnuABC Zn-binding protein ZnuA